MKNFPLEKYKFYIAGNRVIAVSSYGKKRVRGVAVCHPEDAFDLQKGKELAAARCNMKVAEKRLKRSGEKLLAAKDKIIMATNEGTKMAEYYKDSLEAYQHAKEDVQNLLSEIMEH